MGTRLDHPHHPVEPNSDLSDRRPLWHWTVAFAVPVLGLLPATTAMGATLPAMERFVAPMTRDQRCVGALYAANTAGAVIGTLGSAFVIIPTLGFRATVLTLAGVNINCALAVLACGASQRTTLPTTPPTTTTTTPAPPLPFPRLAATVFCTGLLGIGYEVLGIRVMSQVLENTVYSFAAVLSVYLMGTAAGAALYQRFGGCQTYGTTLGYLLTGLATACMSGSWLLWAAKPVYAYARKTLFGDGLFGVMASEMTVATMIFALPTMLMGATFSHLVQGARQPDGGVGRAAAINTIGASFAPLLFVVLMLPTTGAKWALVAVSLGYLALIPKGSTVCWFIQAIPVLMVLALPPQLQVLTKRSTDKVLEYREGVMAAVAVMANADGHRSLRVNNRFQMGDTRGWVTEALQAHVPLLLHPDPQRALFLGLGSAITFNSAAFPPNLHADGVELVPEVVRALHHFQIANLPDDADQRLRIYTADARRFVRATDQPYDVIVADLFHPGRDGAGFLYTREHFLAIRARLNNDGLFCQWLPLYQLDHPMIKVIVRTFLDVFPHTRAYVVDFKIDHPMLGLIATTQPVTYPPNWYTQRVTDQDYQRFLKGLLLTNSIRFFGSLAADTDDLRQLAADTPITTDDKPTVNFGAPLFTSRQDVTPYDRLTDLLKTFSPQANNLLTTLHNQDTADEFDQKLQHYLQARNLYIIGQAHAREKHGTEAQQAYLQSIRTSPDFLPAYAHLITIAQRRAKKNPTSACALLAEMIQARPERDEARRLLSLTITRDHPSNPAPTTPNPKPK